MPLLSFYCYLLSLEIKEVITTPSPIPMSIDATNNRADSLRKMNPTPIPISVVPPIAHVLLSLFYLSYPFFRLSRYRATTLVLERP